MITPNDDIELAVRSGTASKLARVVDDKVLRLADRVVVSPLPVATHAELRRQLIAVGTERPIADGPLRTALALGSSRLVRRSTKLAKILPSGRVLTLAAGASQLAAQVRRGLRELELIASFLVHRHRIANEPVTRDVIASLTLSAYLGQEKQSVTASAPGLIWQWGKRSVRLESERAATRRVDRILAALDSR
jgi:hypothetical protein